MPLTEAPACAACGAATAPDDETCGECGKDLRAAAGSDVTKIDGSAGQAPSIPRNDKTAAALRKALAPGIELVRGLGAGGMSTVYLGRDLALRRMVAIKVLSAELAGDPIARARFTREAEAAAGIVDPHVIDIYQVGALPRTKKPYIVMQFVNGPTVAHLMRSETQIPEMTARAVIGEVASALAAAHDRGVLHRDIKPSNIVIDRETGEATVLDFGISAALKPDALAGDEELTLQGVAVGTPAYMSPEQASVGELTDRSDVYSLGVVAFELLAGRKPFIAEAPEAYLAAHIKDVPPDLARVRPDIDPFLAGVVGRCLAKDHAARPSAAALASAVLRRTRESVEWPPPGLRALRSTGWRVLTSLGVVAAAALGSAVAMWLPTSAALAPGTGVESVWTPTLTVLLAFGLLAAAATVGRTWNLFRHFLAARSLGYPFGVVLDVALDHVPDTPAVVNGYGPYALLSEANRQRLLILRRITCGLLLLALGYVVVSPIWWMTGSRLAPDFFTLVGLRDIVRYLLPPLVCLIVAGVLAVPQGLIRHRFRFGHLFRSVFRSTRPAPGSSVEHWLSTVGRTHSPAKPRPRWFTVGIPLGAGAIGLAVLALLFTVLAMTRTATSVSQLWTQEVTSAIPAPVAESIRRLDATALPPLEIDSSGQPLNDPVVAIAGVGATGLDPLSIIADTTLAAPIRWWSVAGLVTGFCTNSVEILFGVDEIRDDWLAAAQSTAHDLPDIDLWIEHQRDRLAQWRTSPEQAATDRGQTLSMRLLRTFGFGGYVERVTYCRSAVTA